MNQPKGFIDRKISRQFRKAVPYVLHHLRSVIDKSGNQPRPHLFPILNRQQKQWVMKQNSNFSFNTFYEIEKHEGSAAIMIPILDVQPQPSSPYCRDHHGPSILFTVRANHLTHHANEISFPGGHYDSNLDDNLIDTVLREAREELLPSCIESISTGLDASNENEDHNGYFQNGVHIIGPTESVPSLIGIPVCPIISLFKHEYHSSSSTTTSITEGHLSSVVKTTRFIQDVYPGNKNEVSKVFTVPIQHLIDIECEEPIKRFGGLGPVYNTKYGRIWGLTAMVLKPILHHILNPVFSATNEECHIQAKWTFRCNV